MHRTRVWDLALVAVASGLLAFEVTSLQGALPVAMNALSEQGVLGEVHQATRSAAIAASAVWRGVGTATTQAALGVVKETARRLGTVTPPAPADRFIVVVNHERVRPAVAGMHTVTVDKKACRKVASATARRLSHVCRELEGTRRRSTL